MSRIKFTGTVYSKSISTNDIKNLICDEEKCTFAMTSYVHEREPWNNGIYIHSAKKRHLLIDISISRDLDPEDYKKLKSIYDSSL